MDRDGIAYAVCCFDFSEFDPVSLLEIDDLDLWNWSRFFRLSLMYWAKYYSGSWFIMELSIGFNTYLRWVYFLHWLMQAADVCFIAFKIRLLHGCRTAKCMTSFVDLLRTFDWLRTQLTHWFLDDLPLTVLICLEQSRKLCSACCIDKPHCMFSHDSDMLYMHWTTDMWIELVLIRWLYCATHPPCQTDCHLDGDDWIFCLEGHLFWWPVRKFKTTGGEGGLKGTKGWWRVDLKGEGRGPGGLLFHKPFLQ